MLTEPTYDELEQKVKELEKETLDLRRMEEELREREEQFRNLVEGSLQGTLVHQNLKPLFLNKAYADIYGYSLDEIMEMESILLLFAPDEHPRITSYMKARLRGEDVPFQYEYKGVRKDGSLIWLDNRVEVINWEGKRAIQTNIFNITERKRAEEQLRESEVQKRAILDASIDRIRYVDKDMKIIWANKAMATAINTSHEDLVGRACYEVLLDRDSPCEGCPTPRAGETGQIERAVIYQPWIKDVEGESYWDTYAVPLKNEAEEIASFIQVARDITDQKRAMDALKKSEETLKAILAASPVGIGLSHNRIMGWANKALYRMLGYEEGSLLGKSTKVVYPDDEEYERAGRELYSGVKEAGIGQVETRWVKKDGSVIDCYLRASPLDPSDPNKDVIVAVMDISAHKQAEEQIHVLNQELIKAHENERQMISRELHDRLGQDLSMLKIGLDTLFDIHSEVPNEMMGRVLEFSKVLQRTIQGIRDLSYDLRPPSLDQLGLVRTLFQYCNDFSEKTGLSVDFSSAGMDDLKLDFDTEINIYRLVQEGLNNIWKHADARNATIRLLASFPNLILRIEDDGKGFNVGERLANITNEKRMGLRSMAERVNLLGGSMKIRSRQGKGTKIFIEIPYKA